MSRLGIGLTKLIHFHMKTTNAEVYFIAAENKPLKSFYDRLAKQYANRLEFNVISGLGYEKLDYAIKTPYFTD